MADLKYLAVSDIQFPLHDEKAVQLWLNVVKGFKPNIIDLVGDIDNADATSRWAAGSADELFYGVDVKKATTDELEKIALSNLEYDGSQHTKNFLADLRKLAPKADIHLHDGNHGWTRHENYFKSKAPALLEKITPDTLYGLDKNNIVFHRYDALPYRRFHDMYIHHGSAVSKHSGESVKADIDAWGVSIIRGHSHRVGDYHKTYELTGQRLEGYEIGHLMDVNKADYSNQRNWQQGFIYGYIDDNDYYMNLVKIKNYSCYVDGKKYSVE
jgi:hypothetical protein